MSDEQFWDGYQQLLVEIEELKTLVKTCKMTRGKFPINFALSLFIVKFLAFNSQNILKMVLLFRL